MIKNEFVHAYEIEEVAERLGKTVKEIRRMYDDGVLPEWRINSRKRRMFADHLEEYIAAQAEGREPNYSRDAQGVTG